MKYLDDTSDEESLADLPSTIARTSKSSRPKGRISSLAIWLVMTTFAGVVLVLHLSPEDPLAIIRSTVYESSLLTQGGQCSDTLPVLDAGDHGLYLHGPPSKSFRGKDHMFVRATVLTNIIQANLRNESQYITGWGAAGWSKSSHILWMRTLTGYAPTL